jgi:hypothetical protein
MMFVLMGVLFLSVSSVYADTVDEYMKKAGEISLNSAKQDQKYTFQLNELMNKLDRKEIDSDTYHNDSATLIRNYIDYLSNAIVELKNLNPPESLIKYHELLLKYLEEMKMAEECYLSGYVACWKQRKSKANEYMSDASKEFKQ